MRIFALFWVVGTILVHNCICENRVSIGGREYIIFAELYDRPAAVSLCQSNEAQLIVFETEKEQIDVAQFLYSNDFPFLRAYWTDAIRSLNNLDVFVWESTGTEVDKILWAPNEPNPSMDNSWAYFLSEDIKMITGLNVFTHSVICEIY